MASHPLHRILSFQSMLVAAVPALLALALGIVWFFPQISREIDTRHRQLAGAITSQVENYLASALNITKVTAAITTDQKLNWHDIQRVLDAQSDPDSPLRFLYITGRDGRVIAARNLSIPGKQQLDILGLDLWHTSLFLDTVKEQRAVWSDTFLSIVGGGPAVAVAVPAGNNFVFGEVDTRKLTEFLKRSAIGKGQLILLIDHRGQIIADQDGRYTAQQLNISNIPLIRDGISSAAPLTGKFQFNNRSMVGSISKCTVIDWYVLVAQPAKVAYQSVTTMEIIVGLGLLSALLFGTGVAISLSRKLARPFETLEANARCLAKGEGAGSWPVINITEFDRLSEDLQLMAAAIKTREGELTENAAFRKRVYDSSRTPIVVMDAVTLEFIDCNPAAVEIYRYASREETLGKTPLDVSAPLQYDGTPSAKKAVDYIAKALTEGSASFEWRHQRHDGECWDAEVHLISFSSGQRQLLQFTLQDISERKQALLDLKFSEERLQLYFQRLPIASIIWGKDFRVQQWNPAAEQIFGYSATEAVGRTANELIVPEYVVADVDEIWRMLFEGNLDANSVNDNMTKDGRIITCYWTNTPYKDSQGQPIGVISIVEDITVRREMEAEINKLSQAIEQSPVMIIITDPDGTIEYVNPKFCQLTGYSIEDAIGRNPRILKSGTTPAETYRHLWETITSGGIWQGDICNMKKDGQTYWESACIAPIFDGSGAITHFVAVKEDITEKKRMQDSLEESEEKFAKAFRNMPAIVVISTLADGKVLEVNDTFEKLFGYSRAEAIGRTALELGLRNDPRDRAQMLKLLKEAGSVHDIETVFRKKNGDPLIGLFSGEVINLYGKQCLISMINDITARKQIESALRESEELFREMFSQNYDAIILIQLDTLKVTFANQAALDLYGYSEEELTHLQPWDFMAKQVFQQMLKSIKEDGTPRGFLMEKYTAFRKDRSSLLVSFRGKIIQMKDEYVILCSIRDITERTRLEETIRTSHAKLIQANKMTSLGMLVSSVAHEINNPNQCIAVNTTVLTNIWRDVAPIVRRHCAETGNFPLGGLPSEETDILVPQLFSGIAESSQRINAIIANMKDFVKSGDGKKSESFDVNRIIKNATDILWHHINKFTNDFRQELADAIPTAYGNAQQIEQVVINLIMNALQSLPDKSHGVCVKTAFDEPGGKIVITVADAGKGMDRRTLQRLSEPFFTTRESEGGTGLGLYISTSIVKDYHGSLEFDSETGEGTTATVRLPLADGPLHPAES